jgi:hypothetical protein
MRSDTLQTGCGLILCKFTAAMFRARDVNHEKPGSRVESRSAETPEPGA